MELLDMAMIVYRMKLREVVSTETAVMAVHYATEMNIRIFIVPLFTFIAM
jgi:hypothetical protein